MSLTRSAVMLAVAAAVVVALPLLTAGCGSDRSEFDKSVYYTPESLAQELITRYRALSATEQSADHRPSKEKWTTPGPEKGQMVSKKSTTKKRKNSSPAKIDGLLEDIEFKVALITETSPSETTKNMIEHDRR